LCIGVEVPHVAVQNLTNCHINGALDQINQAECGAHYIIIYRDLDTLIRYTKGDLLNYVRKQIKENNEIVFINPFYETAGSVRQVLSEKYNHGMDDILGIKKKNHLSLLML
jgi:hypothetical protein